MDDSACIPYWMHTPLGADLLFRERLDDEE